MDNFINSLSNDEKNELYKYYFSFIMLYRLNNEEFKKLIDESYNFIEFDDFSNLDRDFKIKLASFLLCRKTLFKNKKINKYSLILSFIKVILIYYIFKLSYILLFK